MQSVARLNTATVNGLNFDFTVSERNGIMAGVLALDNDQFAAK
jgi:hypothetical protein